MVRPQPKYLEKEVFSASEVQRVIMLYNRAISHLKTILNGASIEDPVAKVKVKAEAFGKTIDILSYLQACLNLEKGGEIAKNLQEIYEVMITELTRASISGDQKPVMDSIEILEKLRNAYQEIMKA